MDQGSMSLQSTHATVGLLSTCVDRTVVWNVQETPVDTCDTFNTTSRAECGDFCLNLDAGNYEVDVDVDHVAAVTFCQCGTVTVFESVAAKSSI
jgi:hypothetical protein